MKINTASTQFALTVDTTSPDHTFGAISATDDTGSIQEVLPSGGATDDRTPTLSGSLSKPLGSGEHVIIMRDGVTVAGTVSVNGTGWTYAEATNLADGTHTYTVKIVDAAGNVGTETGTFNLVVDTAAPTMTGTITGAVDATGTIQHTVTSGGSTDDKTPVLNGTLTAPLESGAKVEILRDGSVVGTWTGAGTNWTYEDNLSALADGTHNYTVRVVDAVGNATAPSGAFQLSIDTTKPAQVATITGAEDNTGTTVAIANGGSTDDLSPKISGALSAALAEGELLYIYRSDGVANTVVGSLSLGAGVTAWSFEDTSGGMTDGHSYVYTAKVIDAVGNEGAVSTGWTVLIDQVAPTATAIIERALDDEEAVVLSATSGGYTNDTTPVLSGTLNGTLDTGDTLAVYRGGSFVGTASVVGSNWLFEDTGLVNATTYSYTVRIIDAAGNEGTASAPFLLTVDQDAPTQTFSNLSVTDDHGPITTSMTSGGVTDDTKPTLTGNLSAVLNTSAGEYVEVLRDGSVVGTATVTGTGWSYNEVSNLDDGTYSYTVRVVDGAGNVGAPSSPAFTVTVDTVAPDTTVGGVTVVDESGSISGPVAPGGTTNDNTPTLTGTLSKALEDGAVVQIIRDGTVVGTATVTSTGWTYTESTALADETYTYTVRVVDKAGNAGEKSDPVSVIVDASAPTQTTSISVSDDTGSVTGVIASNATTDDLTPTISGTLSATLDTGEYVRIYRGVTAIGTWKGTGTGWSFTDDLVSAGLGEGTYTYTVRVVDEAGNEGTSASTTIVVDTQAPTTTGTIVDAFDNAPNVIGLVSHNGSTNDTSPLLSGILNVGLAGGETVAVYRDGSKVGNASVTGTGWSYQDAGLVEGVHSYTIRIVDAAGNEGTASAEFVLNVDTTAPTHVFAPASAADNTGTVQGVLTSGGTTDDRTPTLSGTLDKPLGTGEYVVILRDGVTVAGTVSVNGTGWTYAEATNLADGTHTYTVKIVDAAGNVGTETGTFNLVVDTAAPTMTGVITGAVDNVGMVSGTVTSGATTDDATPTLGGTLSAALGAGETVVVYRDGVTVAGSLNVSGTGWTFTESSGVADGIHTYTVRVVDQSGNSGSASGNFVLTVDTIAPTQVATITGATDNTGSVTGAIANGGATDDTTPVLTGVLSAGLAVGEYVAVYRDGVYAGSATMTNATNWTFGETLSDGTYDYTVRVVDASGNGGPQSYPAYTVEVDTTAPTQEGTFGGTSGELTDDDTPTIGGTLTDPLSPGEYVEIIRDGTVVGTAIVNGTQWTYEENPAVTDGTHTYTVRVVDEAGNKGDESDPFSVIVDATDPTQVVTFTGATDNTGAFTGTIAHQGSTDDVTPIINGTLSAALGTGDYVQIYRNGVAVGTWSGAGTGWSFTEATDLADTTYTYTARVIDAAGNEGALTGPFTITIDTDTPDTTATIARALDDEEAPVVISSGGTTDDTTPVLNGSLSSGLTSGEKLAVYRDGSYIGSATVVGTGWSYTDSLPTTDATYSYTVKVIDAAGNEGAASPTFSLTIDKTAPAATASISAATDDAGVHTTTGLTSGATTDDTSPTLTGALSSAAVAGDYVEILRGGVVVGTVKLTAGDTTWSYGDSGLSNGSTYTYTARVVDAAGNKTGASSGFVLHIDTSSPTLTASISSITDNTGSAQGTIAKGGATDDTTPTISGTISAVLGTDERVIVYHNGTAVGTASVTGTGWVFTQGTNLSDGTYDYTVRVENTKSGTVGSMSGAYTIEVDTTAPTQEGTFGGTSGELTDDDTPTIGGTLTDPLSPGEYVEIIRDGTVVGTAIVNGTQWTYEENPAVTDGTHTYTVRVVDEAGNKGDESDPFSVIVDATDPTQVVTFTGATDNTGAFTGTIAHQGSTDDTTPIINGTLSAALGTGDYVQIYRNGVAVGTWSGAGTGWSFTEATDLADTTYTYTARVIDAAGNEGALTGPFTITIDTDTPDTTATIARALDDEGEKIGFVTSGSIIDDTSPILMGTLSATLETGAKLAVFRDGDAIGYASVSGQNWSFVDDSLADDTYFYTVRVVDAAGNVGEESNPFTLTVDTSVPTVTASISYAVDDAGASTGTLVNGATTDDTKPAIHGTLTGALDTGEYVEILRNGEVVGTATVSGTNWTYTETTPLGEGIFAYTARMVGAGGNVGSETAEFTLSIGTTAQIDEYVDDTGLFQGARTSGSYTDDTTPTLKGVVSATLDSGSYVEVLRNNVVVGTATVTSGTAWEFTDNTGGLSNGNLYIYTVRVVNAQSEAGTLSSAFNVQIDTSGPSKTAAISSALDNFGTVTGTLANGDVTNDTSPRLSGSLSTALSTDEAVAVYRDGTYVGTATLSGSTGWTYTDSGVGEGTHTYTVRVIDSVGNPGTVSSGFELEVDTTPPAAPVIGGMTNDTATTGTATDFETYATDVTVFGMAEAGSKVEIVLGGVVQGTVIVGASGVWSWDVSLGSVPINGTVEFQARATDPAGNTSTFASQTLKRLENTNPQDADPTDKALELEVNDLPPGQGFVILGDTAGDRLGFAVSVAGDVNGDGIADILVGARGGDDGGSSAGEAYIIFGRSDGIYGTLSGGRRVIDLTSLTASQGFIIQGDIANDELGTSLGMSFGDINGDGVDDIIVGANQGDDGGADAGEAYVIFGTTGTFGTLVGTRRVVDTTSLTAAQGFIIQGDTAGDQLGNGVSIVGDINGDGINDILVGANRGDDGGANAGEAYVIFGTTGTFGALTGGRRVIDTTSLTAAQGFIIQGDTAGDNFGIAVSSAGDVNGDGIDDLIVGAAYGHDGGANAGEAYVIFGRSNGTFGTLVGGRRVIDTTSLTAAQGFIIQGDTASDGTGFSVSSAGDLNGDGIDDLLVGGLGVTSHVIFGTTGTFGTLTGGRRVIDTTNLSAAQGFVINGDADGRLGISVKAAGDVNGDGIDDIIVGDDTVGGSGAAYIIYGTTGTFGEVVNGRTVFDVTSMTAAQGFVIKDILSESLGRGVSAVGDVNGDGYDDLLIGAQYDDDGGTDSGAAYIIYGGPGFTIEGPDVEGKIDEQDYIGGTSVNDTVYGFGGADVIMTYGGNDTIYVPDDDFARVDGGTGFDKLVLTGSNATLDFTNIASDAVTNIEMIWLSGAAQTLTLRADDVLKINDEGKLLVDGSSDDTVNAAGFTNSGTTGNYAGNTYHIYTNGSAKLWIDEDIGTVVVT